MNYEIYKAMGISEAVLSYSEKILSALSERFSKIDEIAEYNQAKVLAAFRKPTPFDPGACTRGLYLRGLE